LLSSAKPPEMQNCCRSQQWSPKVAMDTYL
jgi:hypothetical protein